MEEKPKEQVSEKKEPVKKGGKGKKVLLIFVGVMLLLIFFGSGKEKKYSTINNQESSGQQKVTKTELLNSNEPNIKRFNFATDDYVGQSFSLYVMANVADYYNYGFSDESRYYSIRIWDNSVDGEYEGAYAYIDKTKSERKAKELLDNVLENPIFTKVTVSIPVEKYSEGGNAFFEIESWEIVE